MPSVTSAEHLADSANGVLEGQQEGIARARLHEPRPGPPDSELGADGIGDRVATAVVTIVPLLALGIVAWQTWSDLLRWHDLVVFAILYMATGLGVTVGFHRLLTHRSFATRPWVRAVLAVMGSAAIEGPVIEWVANHRKHHAYSDCAGDPHSPHVGHAAGWRGALRGLAHAHLGWLFGSEPQADQARYAPDLLSDPVIRFVDRTFVAWVALGLAVPFGLGVAIGGTVTAGLTGLLWGGAVRILVLHHVTFSINSLCHFFGRQRFDTGDQSRNLAWLAPLSLGEAWHNNHHAFPTSARHGLSLAERVMDPSALFIGALERVNLAWDVVRVPPERQATKLLPPGTA